MDNLGSLNGLLLGTPRASKKGGVVKGQTTVLVDSGIYAFVRHPMYLAFIFINLALILIAQHWLVAIIGVAGMVLGYLIALKEERELVERFGDDSKRYMQRGPRMDLLVGVIRLLRRRKRD